MKYGVKYYDGFGKDVTEEIAELERRVETLEREKLELLEKYKQATEITQGGENENVNQEEGLAKPRRVGRRRARGETGSTTAEQGP